MPVNTLTQQPPLPSRNDFAQQGAQPELPSERLYFQTYGQPDLPSRAEFGMEPPEPAGFVPEPNYADEGAGYWDAFTSGLDTIPEQFQKAYYGSKNILGDSFNNYDWMVDAQQNQRRLDQEIQDQRLDIDPYSGPGFTQNVAGSVGSLGATLGAGILGTAALGPAGGIALGVGTAGTLSGATEYGNVRARGGSTLDAAEAGTVHGLAEAIPEVLPLGFALKPGVGLLRRTAGTAGRESLSEYATGLTQGGYDEYKATGDIDVPSLAKSRLYDAAIGGVLGTAMGPIAHPVASARDNSNVSRRVPETENTLSTENEAPASTEKDLEVMQRIWGSTPPTPTANVLPESQAGGDLRAPAESASGSGTSPGPGPDAPADYLNIIQSQAPLEQELRNIGSSPDPTPTAPEAPEPSSTVYRGSPERVYTPSNKPVETEYALVEGASLVTSNDETGRINPVFPKKLQPRDRSRDTSQAQISRISNELNPELLGKNPSTAEGAPIISKVGRVVESGNARVNAITKAYREGGAQRYRDYLIANAQQFGLDPGVISQMETPILVRRRMTDMTPQEMANFVVDSNQSGISRMSPSEQAKVDANLLNDEDFANFAPDESGNVLAASNRTFIRRFLSALGGNETAALLDENGQPNRSLADRLRAAVFSKAYQDDRLITLAAEEADPDIKNILNALSRSAPGFARARAANNEMTDAIVKPIVESIEHIRSARGNNVDPVELLNQADITKAPPSPSVQGMVRYITRNMRSAKSLGRAFRRAAEIVEQQAYNENNQDFFGDNTLTNEQIIEESIGQSDQDGATQQDVFGSTEDSDRGTQQEVPERQAGAGGRVNEPKGQWERNYLAEAEREAGQREIPFPEITADQARKNPKRESKKAIISLGIANRKGSVLANKLSKDFKEKGLVNLIGQKITSPGDLAVAAQVYRNPSFETFRTFYIKDGVVVGQNAITSRDPGFVSLGKTKNTRYNIQGLDIIGRDSQGIGADGFYILHNHPSGVPKSSEADIFLTQRLERMYGEKLLGHVIIDNNKYNDLGGGQGGDIGDSIQPLNITQEYTAGVNPLIDHEMLGVSMVAPSEVAKRGKALTDGKDVSVVIGRSGGEDGGISGLVEISNTGIKDELFKKSLSKKDKTKLLAAIHRFRRQTASVDVILYTPDMAVFSHPAMRQAIKLGVFVDVVTKGGLSQRIDMGIKPIEGFDYGRAAFNDNPASTYQGTGIQPLKSGDSKSEVTIDDKQQSQPGVKEEAKKYDADNAPARRDIADKGFIAENIAKPIISKMDNYFAQIGAGSKTKWLDPKQYTTLGRMDEQGAYKTRWYRLAGDKTGIDDAVRATVKPFKNANQEQKEQIYRYLTGETESNAIEDANLRRGAEIAKKRIQETGMAMVRRGWLPREVYEANKDGYLPRIYLKHLLNQQGFKGFETPKISERGYLKEKKNLPEDVRHILLGQILDPSYLVASALQRPMRDMAMSDYLADLSANQNWTHPDSYAGIMYGRDKNGNFRVAEAPEGQEGRRVTADWLFDEATRLEGQLPYMKPEAAKQAQQAANDMRQIARKTEKELGNLEYDPSEWRRLPQNRRYGALNGALVRREVHGQLTGRHGLINAKEGEDLDAIERLLSAFDRYVPIWKGTKVAMNPPSVIRNIGSNVVMMNMAGVPLTRIVSRTLPIIRAMRYQTTGNGQKPDAQAKRAWDIARLQGGVKGLTMSDTEFAQLEREIAGQAKHHKYNPISWFTWLYNKSGNFYGNIESLGKTIMIEYALADGMSAEDAIISAHETLYDYGMIPHWAKTLRSAPIGVPFLTFYIKTLARMPLVAMKHPVKFAAWAAAPMMMTKALIAELSDVDEEEVEKLQLSLSKWMQEKGGGVIMPFKDSLGRWQYVDVGYFLPWTLHLGMGKKLLEGKPLEASSEFGLLGAPLATVISALKTNKDPFTGREIVNEFDPPQKQAVDTFVYAWRFMAPTYMTDIGAINKTWDALAGKVSTRRSRYGEPGDTVAQAMARFFGVNIYPVDPEITRRENVDRMKYEIRMQKTRLTRAIRDAGPNATREELADLREDFINEIIVRQTQLEEYKRASAVHPNLKRDTGN